LCKDRNPTLKRWEWVGDRVIRCPVCGNTEDSRVWADREAAKAAMDEEKADMAKTKEG
jgi:hypothetical protein